ncbi:MAG TPA: NUMOD3 domain-containing DNA-binding protein [Elusimicrobiales bacterium]|nr:NUMOD3 domain-containing DNA-binding protein [Elusimicrobiales bacterium]
MPREGQTGGKHSEEVRKKISDAVRRAYSDGKIRGVREKNGYVGKGFTGRHTEETKARISANRKGKAIGNKNALGHTSWNKGKPHPVHNEEWRKKVSEKNSGENHWNWQGGKTEENSIERNSSKYKTWMHSVFKRDGWQCQRCGYKGRSIVAHHIVYFSEDKSLRYIVENGVTLCRECHCFLHSPRLGTGKSSRENGINSVEALTYKAEGNAEPAREIAKGSLGVCDGQR